MSEVVNLRMARKAKRRSQAEDAAAANRLRFGRTSTQREGQAMEAGRAARLLDGAKLEDAKLEGVAMDGGVLPADPRGGSGG